MERLTTTNKDVSREMICRNENCGVTEEHCPHLMEDECACLRDAINKLADYEDAEEQGLLHKFSCRVGDIIYFVTSCDILRKVVINIKIDEDGIEYYASGIVFREENIGECIFLSEKEAEAALAEKGGAE